MKPTTISATSKRLSAGEDTAVGLCRDLLDRASSSGRWIGAFSYLLPDAAMAEARASDLRRQSGRLLGPLDGIPIAVKDLIDTVPAVCKAGLAHLSNYRPTTDAPVVRMLRDGGAVIVGVTETDPGAFSTETAQTFNPLAPARTAGGSSGGSAAAVAGGLAVAAIGTDTGGSIRIPAACCSVYGFKPTWGRVASRGVRPLAPSLDHVGPLARCVADLQILQATIDPSLEKLHVGFATDLPTIGTDWNYFADTCGQVGAAMVALQDRIASSAGTIMALTLPHPDHVLGFHFVNLPKEAADYHLGHFPEEWGGYPPIARDTIRRGLEVRDDELAEATASRERAARMVDSALDEVDILMLPTMPIDAPLRAGREFALGGRVVSKLEATIRYTALFNQTGHPVVSMPVVSLPDGRAISVQLVGRRGGDARLLAAAERLERLFSVNVDYDSIVRRHEARMAESHVTNTRLLDDARA